jgi:hypothetical protein
VAEVLKRLFLAPVIALLIWIVAALPCSLSKRAIWTKDPKSSSPLFRVVLGGKAGYINQTGRIVIAPNFNPYYVEPSSGDFFEGLALVFVSDGLEFIDETGRVQDFHGLKVSKSFSESLTTASRTPEGSSSRNVLLVDRTGHVVAAVDAYWMEPFSEGWAAFAANETVRVLKPDHSFGHRRGYINKRGQVTIAPKFAYAGRFSEGLAAIALDGPCWVAGWAASPFPAPSAKVQWTSCGPQAADWVTEPCRHGYIDKSGRLVIPARYELAQEFSNGRAAVRLSGKWGFIDRNGTAITPFHFDEVRSFSADKAAVRIRDKWGYIDRLGVAVIQPQFADALSFSNGLAAVKRADHYCYVNEFGAVVIPGPYLQATQFVRGLAHVQIGPTKWAWIDPTGNVVFGYDWKQEF